MAIVDAQIHLWRNGSNRPPHRPEPFEAGAAIHDMDEAGVDAAIIHPPITWDPDSNELAVEAARTYPNRFAIFGCPQLDRPDSPEIIRTLKEKPGMLGLRFYFRQPHNQSWPFDGTLDWLWPAAAEAGLPTALLADDWLPTLGKIAEKHPDLKLIVDHMGAVREKGDAAFPNMKELLSLARQPNVAVKLTGGPFYADDPYPFRSLHKHYRAMYEAFGPDRLFWGTDITKMPCSWRDCVTHFQEIDWMPEADKKRIMGDAICDWIGWER